MTELAHDLYLLVAVLGLALAVSYAGQPVLCQGAFVAVGAFGVVRLERAGLPLLGAVLVAVAMAAALGVVVAGLTARLHGASLALSTWTIAWLAYEVLLSFRSVSGGADGLIVPTPVRLHSAALHASLTLTPAVHAGIAGVLCLAIVAAVARWQRGPSQLGLAAVRTSPALATSLGVPVARRRATVLAATAALGALAGAGDTLLQGVAAPAEVSPLLSVQLLVALLVAARTPRVWAPVAGWAVLVAIPHVAGRIAAAADLPTLQLRGVVTALVLLAVVLLRGPITRVAAALSRPVRDSIPVVTADETPAGTLTARDLSVRLGGVTVVDGVSLTVRPAEVHALVGPNGSGKTTVLRVLAGSLPPDAGHVDWRGADITRAGQLARVRAGVTRTFQRTVELPDLSPYRQVRLGALVRGGDPDDALRLAELDQAAHADPRALAAGQLRLLQVARAAATGAGVLLLDEPAAGMDAEERQRLRRVVRRLAESGVGVLLVEHDLPLVTGLADRVTVLDGGRVVAHGTPAEVQDALRETYLGVP